MLAHSHYPPYISDVLFGHTKFYIPKTAAQEMCQLQSQFIFKLESQHTPVSVGMKPTLLNT